jgi:hypothetical protein
MLRASNSNYLAAKAAKRKAIPRLKLDGVETPVAPPRARPTKQPPLEALKLKAELKLKDALKPKDALKADVKVKAPVKLKLPVKQDTKSRDLEKSKYQVKLSDQAKLKDLRDAAAAFRREREAAEALPPIVEITKPRARFDFLHALTMAVAVVLAVIAAYFSVSGMTRIFPGAELAVIVMASTMEAGKLAGAAWLSRNWSVMAFGVRAVLSILVVILACINAVGVFGQLTAAHLNPHMTAVTANETEAANQGAKIDAQQRLIADLNRRVAQIDSAIEEATKRGRSNSAMDLAKEQRRNRADLVQQLGKEESALVELRTAQARLTGEQQIAAADVGVLQYAATLFGIDREQMIQLLILAMVLSCDPLSITLVIATASRKAAEPQITVVKEIGTRSIPSY